MSVPIPPDVAAGIVAVLNGNPVYVFWTGSGKKLSAFTNWQHDIRALSKGAGIKAAGNMLSHRLHEPLRWICWLRASPWRKSPNCSGMKASRLRNGTQDRLDSLVPATWK